MVGLTIRTTDWDFKEKEPYVMNTITANLELINGYWALFKCEAESFDGQMFVQVDFEAKQGNWSYLLDKGRKEWKLIEIFNQEGLRAKMLISNTSPRMV
jgi:hypothetical protein